jgi:NitT/TauT family transport system ATP-binding protein
MLFQTPMLFPWLTTRKNILFGPKAQRSAGLDERDDPELDAEADAILGTVGLAKFGDAFPHELSGGMQHGAAFARAMITRPSLLLMDEPFGALDAITRLRMHDFLLSMWCSCRRPPRPSGRSGTTLTGRTRRRARRCGTTRSPACAAS